jgi:hypothetical protein
MSAVACCRHYSTVCEPGIGTGIEIVFFIAVVPFAGVTAAARR